MSFLAYQLKFSFVQRFGYQRIVSFYLLENRWPPANGWHVKPTCLAHNEIIQNTGARVKIWPMSVTALLGEALRWARGARVCNKPALFWRFGGAVAIWVCISFAYSTSSKNCKFDLGETHPQNIPGNRLPSFFPTWGETWTPKRTPKHTHFGELLGSWRGGTTTTTTAHHVQKHRPRPLATVPWISLLHSFGGGTTEHGWESNLDMCVRNVKTHQALAFANSWLLQPEKIEKSWGQMVKYLCQALTAFPARSGNSIMVLLLALCFHRHRSAPALSWQVGHRVLDIHRIPLCLEVALLAKGAIGGMASSSYQTYIWPWNIGFPSNIS